MCERGRSCRLRRFADNRVAEAESEDGGCCVELLHSRPSLLLVAPINAEAGDGDADTKRWWLSAVE